MSIKNTSDKDCLVLHCAVPGHEYDINIGSGLLSRAVDYIPNGFLGKKIAIVTDSNVEPLYAKTLTTALRGFDTRVFTVPAGEHSKSEQSLFKLYAELLEFEMISADTSFSGFSSYSSFSGSQNEMLMLASTLTFEEREKPE